MERTTSLSRAKEIMGNNFIGPVELKVIEKQMGIYIPDEVLNKPPTIQFDEVSLKKYKNDYILILGIPYYWDKTPLTIVKMREHFGLDPEKSEPCFYNQDWYINEEFANKTSFETRWYMLKKNVYEDFRAINSNEVENKFGIKLRLPLSILCAYTFFSYYFNSNGEILWKKDFIWCTDKDVNDDQVYVGRYEDPNGVSKNGFNIHRHLTLKKNYSFIDLITT